MKRNIIANVLGGSWSSLLALVIVPFQIRILGVEAYGLLAFLASLQIVFSIFDLGLSPTITREVAGDTSPDFSHSRSLVQGLAPTYCAIGTLLGAALAASAPWFATSWLRLDELSFRTATLAIQLGALTVLIRWPVTFLAGIIVGRQRFDLLNMLTAGATTVGLVGGIIVIAFSSSLTTLLVWRVVTAVVELVLYIIVCFRLLPGLTLWPRFSREAARQVWRFAGSMNLLAILTLVLTQGDKFLISKLLPVGALGYYSLAYNMAFNLALLQGMITTVLFPTFAADYARGELVALTIRCAKAVQIISASVALPAFLLIFFGYDLLWLWIDHSAAQASYRVLGILAVGFLLGAPLNVLSTLAITTGHSWIPLVINVAGLCLYIPCLVLLTTRFSLHGAALTWVVLQLYYLVTLLPLTFSVLSRNSAVVWFGRNAVLFFSIGAVVFGGAKLAVMLSGDGFIVAVLVCGVATLIHTTGCFFALHPDLRENGRHYGALLTLTLKRVLAM